MVTKALLVELLREIQAEYTPDDVDADLLALPRQNHERNADMYRKRLAGWTYGEIGAARGLSESRVRELVQREWEDAGSPPLSR